MRKWIKQRIIDPISVRAITHLVDSNVDLKTIWEYSLITLPYLSEHYSVEVHCDEIIQRIRLLIVAQTLFVKDIVEKTINAKGRCTYADVGDSDGSVRLLLSKHFFDEKLVSVGINLQETAVEKIRNKGLKAICADALLLSETGVNYDVISAFETLEHLPDPIGFLDGIRKVTNDRLILSVPYVRRSRVGLTYVSGKWPNDKKPTVENVHIFELCAEDWRRIFWHTGWNIEKEWKLMMYPSNRLSRFILQPFWRYTSFEGFWFVSLYKDNEYAAQYMIE